MAISYIGTDHKEQRSFFTGISTDTPTASNIPNGIALVAGSIIRDSDTGNVREYSGGSWQTISSGGVPHALEQGQIGGERNSSSSTNNYDAIREECNLSVISKITAVTIGGGAPNDTHLMNIEITATLTGTCVITGFADSDGTAQAITYPASTPAGVKNWLGSINSVGGITVTCSNALDDNLVLVRWRPK